MVDQLIKEKRKLVRQVERLTAKGTGAASSTIERGLRTIQRRVQRALSGTTTTRRRRPTAAGTRRRRTTSTTTAARKRTTRTRASSSTPRSTTSS
jgi:hypothetical protein